MFNKNTKKLKNEKVSSLKLDIHFTYKKKFYFCGL